MQKQVHTYQFFRSGPLPWHRAEKHRHKLQGVIKKVLTIIFLLLSVVQLHAQDLGFQWVDGIVAQAGGLGTPVSSIATDASGNTYATGGFDGTTDFDPGPGVFNLTAMPSQSSIRATQNTFVCKYDPDGKLIWAKQFSGPDQNIGMDIATAADGSVYVGGAYRGTTDFDPGPGVSNLTGATGNNDSFVVKLDGNGDFVWVQKLGNDNGGQIVYGLSVAADGSVVTAGEFSGTNNTFTLGGFSVVCSGPRDGFVTKIDPSGIFQWLKRIGGSSSLDEIFGVTTDASDGIYIGGRSGGSTTGMASLAAGGFVIKLDGAGNTVWADLSTDVAYFREIDLDAAGSVYAGGWGGTVNLVKLNNSGVRQWGKTLGSSAENLDVGPDGYLYVAGSYSGTSTIGPSTLTSNGGTDVYITKVDDAGNNIWAKSIGGPLNDAPYSILADQPNQLLVSGYFQQTVDFDPSGATYELTGPATLINGSGFILKLSTPDLTLTLENSLSVLAVGASSDITVYVENIKAVATFSAVSVTISKPTASSGLVLSIDPTSDWTVTQTATQFTLTLVGTIAALDTRLFTAKLARTGGNAGTYNFTPVIANNAGGDTNNLNNRASVVFTKN